jgi:hypothetical protein
MLKFLLIYSVFSVKNRTIKGAMAPASPPTGSVPAFDEEIRSIDRPIKSLLVNT